MLRKISISLFGILCLAKSYAQDTTKTATSPATTITGSVDVYYRYNFANPKDGSFNNYTSFTNSQNSFELGMATVRLDHSFGKASATADLGFGRRAQEFSYNDGNTNGFLSLANVKQLYLSYAISDKFKLTMGKWATHVGYELLDAYANRNYSMDYMFSFGPFSHTGLKADISLTKKTAIMVGVANPTDFATTTISSATAANFTQAKFLIAQLSTATSNDKFKLYLNYQGGKVVGTSVSQFDMVINAVVTDKFNIGYNGTLESRKPSGGSSNSFFGSALYFNVDPTSTFGLTLRGEYFDDKNNILGLSNTLAGVFDATLSANFKVNKLTIIPELRMDAAKNQIFEKNDNTGTKSTGTFILAGVYTF
ncbi:MAG TPA: outer membrane beta-barrel protein [Chitinophagaceae bacterium]|jgi:hypothetical protein